MNVRVTRPVRLAELRISGLDDSISRADMALAIEEAGGASWLDIKTGEIRRNQRRMGAMWASCPLDAAIRCDRSWAVKGRLVFGAGVAFKTPPA